MMRLINPTMTTAWLCWLFLVLFTCAFTKVNAAPVKSHVKSVSELEYGVVLYDYFQGDYFLALVEHEYSTALSNPLALAPTGQVLKGGMMLSYGMPEPSQKLFNVLLDDNSTQEVRNRAWYYLAKIYYNKSEFENARQSIHKVSGKIPENIFFDYYYLATLVGYQEPIKQLDSTVESDLASFLPGYPYLLFNIGIGHLQNGKVSDAVDYLTKVSTFSAEDEELTVLSDRAKNGLAQLSLQTGKYDDAWTYLNQIRTTGLYSNRALLAYAWSAIQRKAFTDAIPALKLLNERSITIPEVQETKVLLSHLYEEKGQLKRALQSNIDAEKAFSNGLNQVKTARNIIDGLDVPREFIKNLEAIMDKSDWYAKTASVDYEKLTPFLIDLMSSNAFNEVLKELADLYTIRDNLNYWIERTNEHRVILDNAGKKDFNQELAVFIDKSESIKNQLIEKKAELKLYTLTLAEKDQDRMTALLDTTNEELAFLDNKILNLQKIDSAYKQPQHYKPMVADHHQRLHHQLQKTNSHILALEPVMRKLVNAELDKHEKRMRYYWAQSKLAKARLYDLQLLSLEQPESLSQVTNSEARVKAQ
jgi:hypothetical protein